MAAAEPTTFGRTCPHAGCHNFNPPQARYCARCGRPLVRDAEQAHPVSVFLVLTMGGVAFIALAGWLKLAILTAAGLVFAGCLRCSCRYG